MFLFFYVLVESSFFLSMSTLKSIHTTHLIEKWFPTPSMSTKYKFPEPEKYKHGVFVTPVNEANLPSDVCEKKEYLQQLQKRDLDLTFQDAHAHYSATEHKEAFLKGQQTLEQHTNLLKHLGSDRSFFTFSKHALTTECQQLLSAFLLKHSFFCFISPCGFQKTAGLLSQLPAWKKHKSIKHPLHLLVLRSPSCSFERVQKAFQKSLQGHAEPLIAYGSESSVEDLTKYSLCLTLEELPLCMQQPTDSPWDVVVVQNSNYHAYQMALWEQQKHPSIQLYKACLYELFDQAKLLLSTSPLWEEELMGTFLLQHHPQKVFPFFLINTWLPFEIETHFKKKEDVFFLKALKYMKEGQKVCFLYSSVVFKSKQMLTWISKRLGGGKQKWVFQTHFDLIDTHRLKHSTDPPRQSTLPPLFVIFPSSCGSSETKVYHSFFNEFLFRCFFLFRFQGKVCVHTFFKTEEEEEDVHRSKGRHPV